MAMTHRRRRLLAILASILTLALAYDGYRWLRAEHANDAIRAGAATQLEEDTRAEVVFAQAYALAAKGDEQRALTFYRQVAASATEDIGEAALYNSGNLYLRQTLALRAGGAEGAETQAMPLLELAKQSYRDLLRRNPAHWDAKYNLERALRLAPETGDADATALPPPPARERAVTTMRGFTLGLP